MTTFLEFLRQPWPWYVTGPLIGLMVPALLLVGNRSFGISSSFRHLCAAALPNGPAYFRYDWKQERWNLVFVAGIALGGYVAMRWLDPTAGHDLSPALVADLAKLGIAVDPGTLLPPDLFDWRKLGSLPTLLVTVIGGFLLGLGSRWAGGCTGGHAIMGIASLQRASFVATAMFMVGGFVMVLLVFPLLLG